MLTNLLPGLRDLRTPLATGYLWLLSLWLGIGRHLPPPSRAHGALKSTYELASAAGRPAILAAVTFLAFMIGSLAEIDFCSEIRLREMDEVYHKRSLYRQLDALRFMLIPLPWGGFSLNTLFPGRDLDLGSRDPRAELKDLAQRGKVDEPKTSEELTRLTVLFDAELDKNEVSATRLSIVNKDLYETYDRLIAEANFRGNMASPVTALAVVAAVDVSWGWGLLYCVALLLRIQGTQRWGSAKAILIQAKIIGTLELPSVTEFRDKLRSHTPNDTDGGIPIY